MVQAGLQLGMLHLFASGMTNIPKCMYFLLSADEDVLDWLVSCWRGQELLTIVKWKVDSHWQWALRIDLGPLDKPGQEAVLPFDWLFGTKPNLIEGILAWRRYARKEKV
jgi:hypothetical protein